MKFRSLIIRIQVLQKGQLKHISAIVAVVPEPHQILLRVQYRHRRFRVSMKVLCVKPALSDGDIGCIEIEPENLFGNSGSDSMPVLTFHLFDSESVPSPRLKNLVVTMHHHVGGKCHFFGSVVIMVEVSVLQGTCSEKIDYYTLDPSKREITVVINNTFFMDIRASDEYLKVCSVRQRGMTISFEDQRLNDAHHEVYFGGTFLYVRCSRDNPPFKSNEEFPLLFGLSKKEFIALVYEMNTHEWQIQLATKRCSVKDMIPAFIDHISSHGISLTMDRRIREKQLLRFRAIFEPQLQSEPISKEHADLYALSIMINCHSYGICPEDWYERVESHQELLMESILELMAGRRLFLVSMMDHVKRPLSEQEIVSRMARNKQIHLHKRFAFISMFISHRYVNSQLFLDDLSSVLREFVVSAKRH